VRKVAIYYRITWVLGLIGTLVLGSACSASRDLRSDEFLVRKNRISVSDQGIKRGKEYSYIKQRPNKRILGIPFYVGIYNLGDPSAEKGFAHWLCNIGEAPVVLDTLKTRETTEQLQLYYFNQGYFNARTTHRIKYHFRKKHVEVSYAIEPGIAYTLDSIQYFADSPAIAARLDTLVVGSLLKRGDAYQVKNFSEERGRFTEELQNLGFYDFSKTSVRFELDSAKGNHQMDVFVFLDNKPVSKGDSLVYRPYEPYQIGAIEIREASAFRVLKKHFTDTIWHNNHRYLSDGPLPYKPMIFEQAINFKTNTPYRKKEVDQTYRHLIDYAVFRTADIQFEPLPSSDTTHTKELLAILSVSPKDKMRIGIEGEGTHASGNLGIGGSFFFGHQNLFHGGEKLDLRLRAAIEAQQAVSTTSIFNTREFGAELGMQFPYFLAPRGVQNWLPPSYSKRSELSIGYKQQQRTDFSRDVFRLLLGYRFNRTSRASHQVNLMDLSYVRISDVSDSTFLSTQRIRTGFENTLIPALSYTYIYNDQNLEDDQRATFFSGKLEFSGNLLSGIGAAWTLPLNDDGQEMILGNPYAQYVKYELDFRKYFRTFQTRKTALRIFAGSSFAYGNSATIPFEKQFFGGGSNDNRAWIAYSMRPGSSNAPDVSVNSGDIKLMMSADYRFNVLGNVDGALFVDAGNIWLMNPDTSFVGGDFEWNRFYKEFAVGAGVGIRYDFDFFILRLDGGFVLRDPSRAEGERFTLDRLQLRDMTLNFGLGYPF